MPKISRLTNFFKGSRFSRLPDMDDLETKDLTSELKLLEKEIILEMNLKKSIKDAISELEYDGEPIGDKKVMSKKMMQDKLDEMSQKREVLHLPEHVAKMIERRIEIKHRIKELGHNTPSSNSLSLDALQQEEGAGYEEIDQYLGKPEDILKVQSSRQQSEGHVARLSITSKDGTMICDVVGDKIEMRPVVPEKNEALKKQIAEERAERRVEQHISR